MLGFGISKNCDGQQLFEPSNGTAAETLPAPIGVPANAAEMPQDCTPVPIDKPLWKLNTDIRPHTRDGNLVTNDRLPVDCAGKKPPEQRLMNIDLSCDSCYPAYSGLLSLARFYHHPLYFNDDCLERCGCERCCCQPARSAMCFFGGALLMPVRACCQCPCSCVPSGGCCQ